MEDPFKPSKEFKIADAKALVDDVWHKWSIDTEDRSHNRFFHEICPLLLIAEYVGDDATRVIFTGNESRFDGLILLGKERKRQKVEISAAIDGRDEALRMELLSERGEAPAFEKIEATENKKNRHFGENKTEAVMWPEHGQDKLLPLFEDRLKKKVSKAKTNCDYFGAWLAIVFDEHIPLDIERKKARYDPICKQMLGNDPEWYAPFSRVFCVGISREYLFDSWKA